MIDMEKIKEGDIVTCIRQHIASPHAFLPGKKYKVLKLHGSYEINFSFYLNPENMENGKGLFLFYIKDCFVLDKPIKVKPSSALEEMKWLAGERY